MLLLQVSYGDEKFPPNDGGPVPATPIDGLVREARDIAEVCVAYTVVLVLLSNSLLDKSCSKACIYGAYMYITGSIAAACKDYMWLYHGY